MPLRHVTVADINAFKLDTAHSLGIDATFLMDRGGLPSDVIRLKEIFRRRLRPRRRRYRQSLRG